MTRIEWNNVNSVVEDSKCCGCLACKYICPRGCIDVRLDDLGFMYPRVLVDKCVNCGLCTDVCQSVNPPSLNNVNSFYVGRSKDKSLIEASSSGGIASELARFVISSGGVYYGVTSRHRKIYLNRIDKQKDIALAQGSKYIQADILDAFSKVIDDSLNTNVFICATPCMCAALEAVVRNGGGRVENLIIASFPCGGWASPQMLEDEAALRVKDGKYDRWVERKRHKFVSMFYRGAEPCSDDGDFSYLNIAFMEKVAIRDSCLQCSFCVKERVGDILIGDWWYHNGAENNLMPLNKDDLLDGVSIIGGCSAKGERLLNSIFARLSYAETDYSDFIRCNMRLVKPWIEDPSYNHSRRRRFVRAYAATGLRRALLYAMPIKCLSRKIRVLAKRLAKMLGIYGLNRTY